jgi:hypothetical protein
VKKYIDRAHDILDTDKVNIISDSVKDQLNLAVKRIKVGKEKGRQIDVEAYSRALPKILGKAEKEIYKASKKD